MRLLTLVVFATLIVIPAFAQNKPLPTLPPTRFIEIRLHYATKPHATPAPQVTLDTFPPAVVVRDGSTALSYVKPLPQLGIHASVVPHWNIDGTITVNVDVSCYSGAVPSRLIVTRTLQLGFSTHLGIVTYKGDAISVGITLAEIRVSQDRLRNFHALPPVHPDPYPGWKYTLINTTHTH